MAAGTDRQTIRRTSAQRAHSVPVNSYRYHCRDKTTDPGRTQTERDADKNTNKEKDKRQNTNTGQVVPRGVGPEKSGQKRSPCGVIRNEYFIYLHY